MIKSNAGPTVNYLYVPPIVMSNNTRWSSTTANGASAARRASSIILIICIHKGCWEEGRTWRKSCAAFMRLSHSTTFNSCSSPSLGYNWGSFGGMKTCSMTECRDLVLVRLAAGMDVTVGDKFEDEAVMRYRCRPEVPVSEAVTAGQFSDKTARCPRPGGRASGSVTCMD